MRRQAHEHLARRAHVVAVAVEGVEAGEAIRDIDAGARQARRDVRRERDLGLGHRARRRRRRRRRGVSVNGDVGNVDGDGDGVDDGDDGDVGNIRRWGVARRDEREPEREGDQSGLPVKSQRSWPAIGNGTLRTIGKLALSGATVTPAVEMA